jgi:hypothetical protein
MQLLLGLYVYHRLNAFTFSEKGLLYLNYISNVLDALFVQVSLELVALGRVEKDLE